MLALAVHVHQQFAQVAQDVLPYGAPVHAAERAPIGAHLAAEEQLARLVGFQTLLGQARPHFAAHAVVQREDALDECALRACAHHAGFGAVS